MMINKTNYTNYYSILKDFSLSLFSPFDPLLSKKSMPLHSHCVQNDFLLEFSNQSIQQSKEKMNMDKIKIQSTVVRCVCVNDDWQHYILMGERKKKKKFSIITIMMMISMISMMLMIMKKMKKRKTKKQQNLSLKKFI